MLAHPLPTLAVSVVATMALKPALAQGQEIGTTYCDWAETDDTIYWTAYRENAIKMATPDGGQIRDVIVSPGASTFAIEIDVAGRKIYWTENSFSGGSTRKIRRADLSGANVEDLIVDGPLVFPAGIALDLRGRKLYWGDRDARLVGRANLDGTGVELIVTDCQALGVALDPPTGRIYWAEESDKIRRANLDGSGVVTVISGENSPNDVAIDVLARKIYWTTEYQLVRRANLDGTDVETIYSGTGNPFGVALDTTAGKVYWSSYFVDLVARSNLDGTSYESLVTQPRSEGFGMAFAAGVPDPGHVAALGNPSVAANDLRLRATGVPPSTPGFFFYGAQDAFLPLGRGFRCVGGPLQRLTSPRLTDAGGAADLGIDLAVEPALGDITTSAPISIHFQFWYRANGSSRLTDATRVDFVP